MPFCVSPDQIHFISIKINAFSCFTRRGGKKTCLFNYFNSIALRNPSHSFTPSLEKQGPLLGTQHESLPAAILQLSEKSAISNSYCCNLKVNIPKITRLHFSFFTHILKWKLSYFSSIFTCIFILLSLSTHLLWVSLLLRVHLCQTWTCMKN